MTQQECYMMEALELAREAAAEGEVPVGCVIVEDFPNRPAVVGGVLAAPCREVLAEFFGQLRQQKDRNF